MKVSMKGEYGVRALVELARHYGEGPLQSAIIAGRQAIPEPYLDQLLTSLKRSGLIRSLRGPQGGHSLIRSPEEISLNEVLTALEGSLSPVPCLEDPACCPRKMPCSLRELCEQVHQATIQILDRTTLGDLADRERLAEAHYAI